jgi:hypothetical protein
MCMYAESLIHMPIALAKLPQPRPSIGTLIPSMIEPLQDACVCASHMHGACPCFYLCTNGAWIVPCAANPAAALLLCG